MISEEDTDKYLAQVLEILKEILNGGGKWALLYAMHQCLLLNRPLPEWLRFAFLDIYDSATAYKIKSWDDAFGRPHPKHTHVNKGKRKFEFRHLILQRVEALRSEMPVDKELFEKIGKDLGIGGGTTISEIHYEELHRLREISERFNEIRDQVLGASEKN